MQYEPFVKTNAPRVLVWQRHWGPTVVRFTQGHTEDYLELAHAQAPEKDRPIAGIGLMVLAFFALVMWTVSGFLGIAPDSTLPLAIGVSSVVLFGTGVILALVGERHIRQAHDTEATHRKRMDHLVAATLTVPSGDGGEAIGRALNRVNGAVADELVSLVNDGSADVAVRAVEALIESEREHELQESLEADRATQAKVDSVLTRASGPRRGKEAL